MGGLNDLLVAWRQNPNPETTLALCAAIGQPEQQPVAWEVNAFAHSSYGRDAHVMLAVGRMLMRLDLLGEAQTALALAGKADPKDWRPFLELGRLLLLRGDALRGAQALRRAQLTGCNVEELDAWAAMALELIPLQKSAGAAAVAEEVGHRGLPWPDDGSVVRVGDRLVSQAAPTAPPPYSPAIQEPLRSEDLTALLIASTTGAPAGIDPVGTSDNPRAIDGQDSPSFLELAKIGLGVPDAAEAAWEAPRRAATAGVWVLLGAALVSAFAIAGAYGFARHVRTTRARQAADLASVVERRHESGRVEELRSAEGELLRMYELAPQNRRVNELWLENRVLASLWYPDPPLGVSDALSRGQELELAPGALAAARLAQRFASHDLGGARDLVKELDGVAQGSALYQLMAGVVLEHNGSPEALIRYRQAIEIDPELALAKVMMVRLTLLERGTKPGRSSALALVPRLDDHPIGRVLRRLQWALDPRRERQPPVGALSEEEQANLPHPLRAMPHLADAVQAIGRDEDERAREHIETGLTLSDSPAALTRFGLVALHLGKVGLARRAAYRVFDTAPEYTRLSALAARIALLEGRFGEADEAVLSVRATRRDLALVNAVAAYELGQTRGIEVAVKVMGSAMDEDPELGVLPFLLPVLRGERLAEPDRLQDLGEPTVLWGELVAVDSALDLGKVDLAQALMRDWGERANELSPYSVRVARLARYSNDPERADSFSWRALRLSDPTPRALTERVLTLLAAGRVDTATSLLNEHLEVLGAYGRWLEVLVTIEVKGAPLARVRASHLMVPDRHAPLALRVLAARALVESAEVRGPEVLTDLIASHPTHPELLAAQRLLEDKNRLR